MRMERRSAWTLAVMLSISLAGPMLIAQVAQTPLEPLSPPAVVQQGAPAVAPQATSATADTVVAPGQSNEWGVSVVWAYLMSVFMQQWKRSGIRGLSENQTRLMKRAVAWLVAALSAIGIHISFDVAAGELLVTGLLWSSVLGAGGEIVRQYVSQQIMYHGVVQKMEA